MEVWINNKTYLYLVPCAKSCWYYKHKPGDSTLWIAGINLFWLVNNGYKRLY